MKKFVLKLDLHDNKEKRKALKIVSAMSGIDSITINMKDKNLVVVGTVDPINVVSKLRKFWPTDIISVGPKEEPKKGDGKKEDEKKEEGKKDEAKKEDGKKEDGKKDEDPKKKEGGKEGEKKKGPPPQLPPGMFMPPYRPPFYNPMNTYYNQQQYQSYPQYPQYPPNYIQRHHSIEENPNACVIS